MSIFSMGYKISRALIPAALTGPLLLLAASLAPHAWAQAYPVKPIRLIVPYTPGAGTDFTAREVGQHITKALGQQVLVDNRPGAGATLGHALVARAQPDGYTLLLATTGGMVSGPALLGNKMPYDPIRDFAPVGLATYVPYSLVAHPGLGITTVREMLDMARNAPRKLQIASPGVGTPNHIGAAQLMTRAGIELLHVPYKGGSMAFLDVVAGNVPLLIAGLLQPLPFHRDGRLRILGVGHSQRLKAYPDIPTIAETIPGYYNTGWWGIVAPAATPPRIVQTLNAIMVKGLAQPEVNQRFEKNGLEISTTTPEGFREMMAADLSLWKKIIAEAKISVDVLP